MHHNHSTSDNIEKACRFVNNDPVSLNDVIKMHQLINILNDNTIDVDAILFTDDVPKEFIDLWRDKIQADRALSVFVDPLLNALPDED